MFVFWYLDKIKKKLSFELDYIVINDGSSDNTLGICLENKIPVINLVHNLGIGGGVQTGYKYALNHNYDIAIQFDGDGQHDANYIEKLATNIDEGNSLVIGSRFVAEESEFKSTFIRRVGIKWLSLLIKICTRKWRSRCCKNISLWRHSWGTSKSK